MQRRSLFVTLLVFAMAIPIGSCSNPGVKQPESTPSTAASTTTGTNVQLGFSAWPGWFPWQVASEKKIFEANKVAVDLKWFDGYLESISTLTAGKLDANSQTLGDTISSIAGGADQVIVLVNDNSTGNDKIIARSGINSIADFKKIRNRKNGRSQR